MSLIFVKNNNDILGIIIRNNYRKEGISFFTPDNLSQQLAYMEHKKGKIIESHIHNIVKREFLYTQEVLFIKKGKLRVDFYDDKQKYVESYMLFPGDVVLLASGGHGFEVIEDIEMFEVKQGPYAGDKDKTRFDGINTSKLKLKGECSL